MLDSGDTSLHRQGCQPCTAYVYYPGTVTFTTGTLPTKNTRALQKREGIQQKYGKLPGQAAKQSGAAGRVEDNDNNSNKPQGTDRRQQSCRTALIRSLCWNVIGVTTVQDGRIVNEHKTNVITLTETKLQRTGKNK